MMQPKVCILSFSNIAWDARVLREIEAASKHYRVDVIGYGNWDGHGIARFSEVTKTKRDFSNQFTKLVALSLGKINPNYWEWYYWQTPGVRYAHEIMLREKYDLIHANDWDSLPVATRVSKEVGSRVLYDAHEYTPAQSSERFLHKIWLIPYQKHLLRQYQGGIHKVITVSEGLRDLYHTNFGWSSEVIMSAPFYRPHEFRPVDPDHIQLVHHGGAIAKRHLEDLIHLVELLDSRYTLHFFLVPTDPGYLHRLKKLALRLSPQRVVFHDPVPPKELSETLTKFDIGIPLLRASDMSLVNAMPNKFFDFIMAGLAIVVSPLPSMQKLVEQHNIGVVAPGQEIMTMAEVLNSLTTDKIELFKFNSLELAKKLNAEVEMEKLMKIYRELLDS